MSILSDIGTKIGTTIKSLTSRVQTLETLEVNKSYNNTTLEITRDSSLPAITIEDISVSPTPGQKCYIQYNALDNEARTGGALIFSNLLNDELSMTGENTGLALHAQNTCSAYVTFVGSTGVIKKSFNVSSVTRTATGTWKVTFRQPMDNTAYLAISQANSGRTSSGDGNDTTDEVVIVGKKNVANCYITSQDIDDGAVNYDQPEVSFFCIGGLEQWN